MLAVPLLGWGPWFVCCPWKPVVLDAPKPVPVFDAPNPPPVLPPPNSVLPVVPVAPAPNAGLAAPPKIPPPVLPPPNPDVVLLAVLAPNPEPNEPVEPVLPPKRLLPVLAAPNGVEPNVVVAVLLFAPKAPEWVE